MWAVASITGTVAGTESPLLPLLRSGEFSLMLELDHLWPAAMLLLLTFAKQFESSKPV
jgi:hypothetical protein